MVKEKNKTKISGNSIDSSQIRDALSRILTSKQFVGCPSIKNLLTFIVESKLTGKTQLKSYTIAVEVFGRPDDHDPQTDSIVRTSAVRMRKLLDTYYAGEGQNETIRIVLNKGSYIPSFVEKSTFASRIEDMCDRALLVVKRLNWLSTEHDLGNFADSLTEEITNQMFRYGEDLIAIRKHDTDILHQDGTLPIFASSYLLRGMIRSSENHIRISFQLVESQLSLIVWSESFSMTLNDSGSLASQMRIANQVAARLLDPHGILYRSLSRRFPSTLSDSTLAIFRFLHYQETFTADTHMTARQSLEKAILNDPDHSCALACLANVYLDEELYGFNSNASSRPIDAVLYTVYRATAIDPHNVMANYNFAMAQFYAGEKSEFLEIAEQSLKLAPYRADNLAAIGKHLMLVGDRERGLKMMNQAMEFNPNHPAWYFLVKSLYHLHGHQYRQALNEINRFTALEFFPFQVQLAVIHGYLGNNDEATRAIHRMLALWPDAAHKMQKILHFWFPYGDLAELFARGLEKAGFTNHQSPNLKIDSIHTISIAKSDGLQ